MLSFERNYPKALKHQSFLCISLLFFFFFHGGRGKRCSRWCIAGVVFDQLLLLSVV